MISISTAQASPVASGVRPCSRSSLREGASGIHDRIVGVGRALDDLPGIDTLIVEATADEEKGLSGVRLSLMMSGIGV